MDALTGQIADSAPRLFYSVDPFNNFISNELYDDMAFFFYKLRSNGAGSRISWRRNDPRNGCDADERMAPAAASTMKEHCKRIPFLSSIIIHHIVQCWLIYCRDYPFYSIAFPDGICRP